jgi:hypothetical protein
MKKETRQKIKNILREYKKEAYECLYPENDCSWGTSETNRDKTLKLMNDILVGIPKEVWPITKDEDDYDSFIVKDGNWRLDLFYCEGKRSANLIYLKDDHTAWVIEGENGKFIDFDIGGS